MPFDSNVKYHELAHTRSWGIAERSIETTGLSPISCYYKTSV